MNDDLHVRRPASPRIRTGALLSDENGRLLLLRPSHGHRWTLPGGRLAAGETPSQSCQRHIAEQLGLRGGPCALLMADWVQHPVESGTIELLFDGGQLAAEEEARVRLNPREVAEYVFCALDDTEHVLGRKLARRVMAAVFARDHGRTLYLEHGVLLVHHQGCDRASFYSAWNPRPNSA